MKKEAPCFSIITVTRDNLTGLKSTAESILMQKNKEYEWIVIDGHSQDGSIDFLKTTDSHWISAPDEGLYDAMNKGIDRANGTYIIFLNAGDRFADPETLSIVKKRKGADFIYGDSFEGDITQKPLFKKALSYKQIDKGLFTHHQAMYYKRACIGSLRYDLSYDIAADYDFTRKFLKKTDTTSYIPEALCLFELGGLSQRNVIKARKEQFQIRKKDGVPWIKNAIIYYIQTIAYRLKNLSPRLYWWLRKCHF